MVVQIKRGGAPAFGSLEFHYLMASDEAEARRQIVGLLESVVTELANVLERVRGR